MSTGSMTRRPRSFTRFTFAALAVASVGLVLIVLAAVEGFPAANPYRFHGFCPCFAVSERSSTFGKLSSARVASSLSFGSGSLR